MAWKTRIIKAVRLGFAPLQRKEEGLLLAAYRRSQYQCTQYPHYLGYRRRDVFDWIPQ
jgi:hypothetical protein